jgi:hypothetical protein
VTARLLLTAAYLLLGFFFFLASSIANYYNLAFSLITSYSFYSAAMRASSLNLYSSCFCFLKTMVKSALAS